MPIQDPYELCRNPYQELKNLSLVGFELREYTKPVNQVSQRSQRQGVGNSLAVCKLEEQVRKRGWLAVACGHFRAGAAAVQAPAAAPRDAAAEEH